MTMSQAHETPYTPAERDVPSTAADESGADLLVVAREVREHAYAPYSGFRVGAAVRTASGNVFGGCNVENASYGLAICAERAAVFNAIAAEGQGCRITAIAVYAEADTCAPCGACRQVLAEFGPDAQTTFVANGILVTLGLGELLPYHFALSHERRG